MGASLVPTGPDIMSQITIKPEAMVVWMDVMADITADLRLQSGNLLLPITLGTETAHKADDGGLLVCTTANNKPVVLRMPPDAWKWN